MKYRAQKEIYTKAQSDEIATGKEDGIDISAYNSPDYMVTQMKEIRLGLEQGVDASRYANPLYLSSQMKEIRKGMEEGLDVSGYATLMFSAREMKKRRTVLLIEMENAPKPALVGQDGYYEYTFQTNHTAPTRFLADGAVDYQRQQVFKMVRKGDILAVYHPATIGEAGRGQQGEELPGKPGKDLKVLYGEGFHVMPDRMTYVADVDGSVEWENQQLVVRPVLRVSGEFFAKTPVLQYKGSVIVESDMKEGTIETTYDIIIDKDFTGGTLKAGRNIVVRQQARCEKTARMEAGGKVSGDMFQNVEIYAKEDVRSNGFIHSVVDTSGAVIVSGSLSEIVGGNIQAENGIEVYNIGNVKKMPTMVEIGLNDSAKRRLAEYRRIRFATENELIQLKESQQQIYNRLRESGNERDAAVTSLLERLHTTIADKKCEMLTIETKIKELEHLKIRKVSPAIRIRGHAYAGCRLKIDGIVKLLDSEMSNITVRKKEGSLEIIEN